MIPEAGRLDGPADLVWRPFHVEGPRLAALEYEIVRGGEVVFQTSSINELRGTGLSFAIDHGTSALEPGFSHLLRAIPVRPADAMDRLEGRATRRDLPLVARSRAR